MQGACEVEARVQAASAGDEALTGALGELEGGLLAMGHGFEHAQDGVDSGEVGQVAWLARTHDAARVSTTGVGDTGAAGEPNAVHVAGHFAAHFAARHQIGPGLLAHVVSYADAGD